MDWAVTASALEGGVWTLRLEGGATTPKIEVSHDHRLIPEVRIEPDNGALIVIVALPREVLSEGLQSIHAIDATGGTVLASLHVAAGRSVSRDMAAELSLLRDELDLLKRAFRRHMAQG